MKAIPATPPTPRWTIRRVSFIEAESLADQKMNELIETVRSHFSIPKTTERRMALIKSPLHIRCLFTSCLKLTNAYVKLAGCHAYVKLAGCHAYVKLAGSHAYVKLARCHAYVKLAGCHVCQRWHLAVLLTPSQKRRKWLLRILNDENHRNLFHTGQPVLTKINSWTHLSNV